MEDIEVNCVVLICGTKTLLKFKCPSCNWDNLAGAEFQCTHCSQSYTDYKICDVQQVVPPQKKRKHPSKFHQRTILEDQEYKCRYCHRSFGTIIEYRDEPDVLRPVYDHVIPYVYSFNNSDLNFVAACQFCNSWKSDHIFKTIDDASRFLEEKWRSALRTKKIRIIEEDIVESL